MRDAATGLAPFGPGHPLWWSWVEAYGLPDYSAADRPCSPFLVGGPGHGYRLPARMANERPLYARASDRLDGEPTIYRKVTLWPCWDAQPFDVFVHEPLAGGRGADILALWREVTPQD